MSNSTEFLSNYFKETFDVLEHISSGAFGLVFKTTHKTSGEKFAVKKVPFSESEKNNVLKEAVFLDGRLDDKYVVKCHYVWIENNNPNDFDNYENYEIRSLSSNRILDHNNVYLLHIQMELCKNTLRYILHNELMVETFEKLSFKVIYILCELFKETVECINYLHKHKPPIIHRDLKPSNILITNGSTGRFVKLADFGLAVFHEHESQSHSTRVGTRDYMPPELITDEDKIKYGVETDIYSLGVILRDIFKHDINNYIGSIDDITKKNVGFKIIELIKEMTNNKRKDRPTCEKILATKILDSNFKLKLEEKLKNNEESKNFDFQGFFIQKKLNIEPTLDLKYYINEYEDKMRKVPDQNELSKEKINNFMENLLKELNPYLNSTKIKQYLNEHENEINESFDKFNTIFKLNTEILKKDLSNETLMSITLNIHRELIFKTLINLDRSVNIDDINEILKLKIIKENCIFKDTNFLKKLEKEMDKIALHLKEVNLEDNFGGYKSEEEFFLDENGLQKVEKSLIFTKALLNGLSGINSNEENIENYQKITSTLKQIIEKEHNLLKEKLLNINLFMGEDLNALQIDPKCIDLVDLDLCDPRNGHIEQFSFGEPNPKDEIKFVRKRMSLSNAYVMVGTPKGYCFLLNNYFTKGTYKEMQRFRNIFHQLNFEVIMRKNLGAKDIVKELLVISKKNELKNHNAFIFINISRSNSDGEIIGFDGKTVEIEKLVDLFNNEKCPAMKRKPRVFFFNCLNSDVGISQSLANDFFNIEPCILRISANAANNDLFLCYSGASRFDCNDGTLFGKAIADSFVEKANYKDLFSIINFANLIQRNMKPLVSQPIELRCIRALRDLFFF